MNDKTKFCEWVEDFDGNYETDCLHSFVLTHGSLAENGMRYCCYCGKVLVEVKFVDPV